MSGRVSAPRRQHVQQFPIDVAVSAFRPCPSKEVFTVESGLGQSLQSGRRKVEVLLHRKATGGASLVLTLSNVYATRDQEYCVCWASCTHDGSRFDSFESLAPIGGPFDEATTACKVRRSRARSTVQRCLRI